MHLPRKSHLSHPAEWRLGAHPFYSHCLDRRFGYLVSFSPFRGLGRESLGHVGEGSGFRESRRGYGG